MFDERIDVSGVRASDALMTQSELFRVNQDLYLQQSGYSFFSITSRLTVKAVTEALMNNCQEA